MGRASRTAGHHRHCGWHVTVTCRKASAAALHVSAVLHFAVGLHGAYLLEHPHVGPMQSQVFRELGQWKFLTFWNMVLQTVYFTICVINDLIGTNDSHPKKTPFIRSLRDFIQASLAFPLSTFVCLTFWSLYAIDRELVFPKAADTFFPWWLNHVMHSNILVFSLLETVATYHKYPSRSKCLLGLAVFTIVYLVWVHIIYYLSGEWVYPVLSVLNVAQRIVFFLILMLLFFGLYFLGEVLNNKVWESEVAEGQKTRKMKKK
ncbi:androgen-induced gene 1 protein-like isoform X1 [Schistocerca gregaria]|uniref:androgen-induced gene 1 protein-like isoform X1 n=1 Tax=Schistocerca gregaria TaxID=7010 RepID=UPI00211F28EE|nr:androgen-induced gene 1 protein-like isoform X1 [Schistocerca gregaria]